METKRRLVLKHKDGYYWSQTAGKTTSLFDAKWFQDQETCDLWLQVSCYAPENADEYRLVEAIQTIEEVTP